MNRRSVPQDIGFQEVTNDQELLHEQERIHRELLCLANRCADGAEFAEALGHSRIAHHVINMLVREGITSAAQVRTLSNAELLDVRGICVVAVTMIRANFHVTLPKAPLADKDGSVAVSPGTT